MRDVLKLTSVVAFVYDFPHFKSAQGLFALKRAGYANVIAVAAPRRELGIAESPFQFRTLGMDDAHHPAEVARALGYGYVVKDHTEEACGHILRSAERGLVLGARVLPKGLAECQTPIVNLHPGVLPLNRGLDTLKWAVHDRLPQAVTAHEIDARVDRGQALFEDVVQVRPDDSPADIYNRVMWRQIELIPRALKLLGRQGDPIGAGVYRRPMTAEQDRAVMLGFEAYKHGYPAICERWRGSASLAREAEALQELAP